MTEEIIRCESLSKHFKMEQPWLQSIIYKKSEYLLAVDNVSFSINKGETLSLVGETGCGKTTIAKLIMRLIEPSAGKIYYKNKNLASQNKNSLLTIHFSTP